MMRNKTKNCVKRSINNTNLACFTCCQSTTCFCKVHTASTANTADSAFLSVTQNKRCDNVVQSLLRLACAVITEFHRRRGEETRENWNQTEKAESMKQKTTKGLSFDKVRLKKLKRR